MIGVFGNNNNFALQIVRYLRDLGYGAELVLMDNESSHFHPSCDSFDLSYQAYVRSVNWGSPENFSRTDTAQVERDIARYDQVWGSGIMPALMNKLGRTLDVFVPYGSDLEILTSYPPMPLQRRTLVSCFELPYWQRRGIRDSRVVAMDRAPRFEASLERVGFKGRHVRALIPILYFPMYERFEEYEGASYWSGTFREIARGAKLVVFHHARHVWTRQTAPGSRKGNDKLIRAFARFVSADPDRGRLVLVEYGPDVNASKALIESLGIEGSVRWMPLLTRRDIMVGLGHFHVSAGDFEVGWASGGVICEALAAGKPLIHYRNDDGFDGTSLPPIIHARTEAEIGDALVKYEQDRARYDAMGLEAKVWLKENSGAEQVRMMADASGARPG